MKLIIRPLLAALMVYLMTPLGPTFNGLLTPPFNLILLALLALMVIIWLLLHNRGGWRWPTTPLDGLLLLWGLVIGIALLANPEHLRRTLIGLWYIGLYTLIWYGLTDLFANAPQRRQTVIDALLIGALPVITVGYLQVIVALLAGDPLPRPVSLIGNPNALAALLLGLLPFAALRTLTSSSRPVRSAWALYTLAVLGLLLLSGSRGGLLGLVILGAVLATLWLLDRGRLSRRGLVMIAVSLLGVGLMAGLVLVQSLATPGRTARLRLFIWESAWQQFTQQPWTGGGLFSFGHGLARTASLPPDQAHSHAHSLPLNVLAELGLVGMLALVVTIIVLWIAIRRNWHEHASGQRGLLIAALAGLAGTAAHHLVDIPAMMPLIALMIVLLLAVVVAPGATLPMQVWWRVRGHPLGMMALAVLLLASGLWSGWTYSRYFSIVQRALHDQDYAAGAVALESVIAADPLMPVYHTQQALLWGLAAAEDDQQAAEQGIAAYERALQLDPVHAPSWANRAALHWQTGDRAGAVAAMTEAVALAPDWAAAHDLLAYYQGGVASPEHLPVYRYGGNTARFQYLRQISPPTFLPQLMGY